MGKIIDVQAMVPGDYSYGYEDGWEELYTGNDTVYGGKTNNSLILRLMQGNDLVHIYAGEKNDVNTNMGDDELYIHGGGGYAKDGVYMRSGRDRDYVEVLGGDYDHINGNEGIDNLCNYSEKNPTIYGGKDDDFIHSKGGSCYAYGSEGKDTYVLYDDGMMMVKDYEMGSDKMDLSYLAAGYSVNANNSGGWDITNAAGKLCGTVDDATKLDYV